MWRIHNQWYAGDSIKGVNRFEDKKRREKTQVILKAAFSRTHREQTSLQEDN